MLISSRWTKSHLHSDGFECVKLKGVIAECRGNSGRTDFGVLAAAGEEFARPQKQQNTTFA